MYTGIRLGFKPATFRLVFAMGVFVVVVVVLFFGICVFGGGGVGGGGLVVNRYPTTRERQLLIWSGGYWCWHDVPTIWDNVYTCLFCLQMLERSPGHWGREVSQESQPLVVPPVHACVHLSGAATGQWEPLTCRTVTGRLMCVARCTHCVHFE